MARLFSYLESHPSARLLRSAKWAKHKLQQAQKGAPLRMKIGIALNAYDTGSGSDLSDLSAHLELALRGCELGLDSVFVFEHHCTGYIVSPSPLLLLGWLAPQVPKALLGTSVVMLPAHNPLRLAEDICLLDNLTGGRLLLGVGTGRSERELALFGSNTASATSNYALHVNDLSDRLADAARDDTDAALRPRPRFEPEQRIFVGSSTEILCQRTGRPFPKMRYYTAQSQRHSPITFAQVTIADSSAAAKQLAAVDTARDVAMMHEHYGAHRGSPTRTIDELMLDQLVGDPGSIREAVLRLARDGVNHLVLEFAFGSRELSTAGVMIETFCGGVLPEVRKAQVC